MQQVFKRLQRREAVPRDRVKDMSISLQTGLYDLCRLRMEKDTEFLSKYPDADI